MESTPEKQIHVFQNRNFSLLFWGILVSNVAHILFSFAISFHILKTAAIIYGQGNATLIQSGYLALNGIILLVLTPLGGVLADKWNKAKIMYITDFIRGFTILGTGIFIILNPTNLGDLIGLFVMNVILSANAGIFSPASSSLLRFIVTDDELMKASSYLQGSTSFQSIVGVLLGGVFYANVDMFWIFVINGVAYLISAITEMFIHYEHKLSEDKITIKRVVKDTRDGLKYLITQKAVFFIIVMALFLNFFFNPIFAVGLPNFIEFGLATEPKYLLDNLISPTGWMSIIDIAFSAAAIIMSLLLAAKPPKEKLGNDLKRALFWCMIPVVVISINMIGYYQGIIPVNTVLIIMIISMFGLGLSNVAINVPLNVVIAKRIDRAMLGKVSSVMSVLSMGLIPFSALLGGLVIAQLSASILYGICALGTILVTSIFIFSKQTTEI